MSMQRNLNETNEDRLQQAARAVLAAAYDPIASPANWPDIDQLSPMAYERLMRIVRAAVGAAPGGRDEEGALREMALASTMKS